MKYTLTPFVLVLCTVHLHAPDHALLTRPALIVLDPAGDTHNPGRLIGDVYERGLAYQYTQQLKQTLEKNPLMHCVITRTPGQVMQPLEQANIANQLQAALFVRIHFFQYECQVPRIYIYFYARGDEFIPTLPAHSLTLLPYDRAHWLHATQTRALATACKKQLSSPENQRLCTTDGPYGLPLKSLLGITQPALVIEIGVHEPSQPTVLIAPLARCIEKIIAES